MILSIFLPVVMLFFSQNSEPEAVPSTKGVQSVTKGEVSAAPENEEDSSNTTNIVTENNSQNSTTVIQEGGSEVSIRIDNSTTSNSGSGESNFEISNLSYPGASAIETSQNRLVLESIDNPSQVTDWYQNRIQELGMNTTSFVRTNSNDVVLNKLAAGGNIGNVSVEISAQPGSNITKIVVTSP